MDFIQMPKCCNCKYIFVIINMFSGGVEACPSRNADATTFPKKLLRECLILEYHHTQSDRGTYFTGQVVQLVCEALEIQQHLPWGAVERKNSVLKTRLAKIREETGFKWPDALPLALIYIKITVNKNHALPPYEVVMDKSI